MSTDKIIGNFKSPTQLSTKVGGGGLVYGDTIPLNVFMNHKKTAQSSREACMYEMLVLLM